MSALLIGASSAIYQRLANSRDHRRYPPPGRLVDIGGRRLHLLERGAGSPAVVIVPALADNVLSWIRIQRGLASDVRVCLYDRAGIGWSDPPPQGKRTFTTMADELHDLLEAAGVPGPYLLVGHSIGGIIGRQLASRYPGDVCGLVLIDSSHEDQLRRPGLANWPHSPAGFYRRAARRQARVLGARRLLASLGASPRLNAEIAREVPPEYADAARAIALSTTQRRTAVREILMMATLTGRPPHLGSLPLVVLTAGRQPPGWFQLQDEMARLSSRSMHFTADSAGHYVHLDDPGLVIQVIRDFSRQLSIEGVVSPPDNPG